MSSVNNNLVFCPPPLGKPDPNLPKPVGEDTRKRVAASGSKGLLCWQSALNLVRDRVKAPNTVGTERRKFEKYASERSKAIRSAGNKIPTIARSIEIIINNAAEANKALATSPDQGKESEAAINRATACLESLGQLENLHKITKTNLTSQASQETITRLDSFPNLPVKLRPVISDFLAQDVFPNFYQFLLDFNRNKDPVLNESFLKKIGENPEDYIRCIQEVDPKMYNHLLRNTSEFPRKLKLTLMDNFAFQATAKNYGFAFSTWKPLDPFETLLQEFREHGPLIMGGLYGRYYYVDKPTQMNSIKGRTVYGWPPNSKRINNASAHVVVLVGGQIKTITSQSGTVSKQELVYYIDPNDPSDPKHPENQLVYVMSYRRLTSSDDLTISDVFGFRRNVSPFPFAYYYPKSAVKDFNTTVISISLADLYKNTSSSSNSNNNANLTEMGKK